MIGGVETNPGPSIDSKSSLIGSDFEELTKSAVANEEDQARQLAASESRVCNENGAENEHPVEDQETAHHSSIPAGASFLFSIIVL